METVNAGGHRIAYERHGEGPPLVLVHGYVGDRRMWRPQIDELSDEFTVVAWDAPGFGGSSDPPEDFALSDFADCLAAFVEALELGRPHVLGLSFGGGLALELFSRHPTLPLTLVLASAYAGWAGSLPAEVADERVRQALRLRRPTAGSVGGGAPSKHVHGLGARRAGRGIRDEHARVSPRRAAGELARIRGGRPSRRPCPRGCAHTAAVRRQGHARSLECCPRPPRRHSRLEAGVHPRSGSRVQHRRPGALQQRGARLPCGPRRPTSRLRSAKRRSPAARPGGRRRSTRRGARTGRATTPAAWPRTSPSPGGKPGWPAGGKSGAHTCSGSMLPVVRGRAPCARGACARRPAVARQQLVLAALAGEDRPVAPDRRVVGPDLGRVRREADVPRAAVLLSRRSRRSCSGARSSAARRRRTPSCWSTTVSVLTDRRVVGRLHAEPHELEEARVDDLALVDRRAAVADACTSCPRSALPSLVSRR